MNETRNRILERLRANRPRGVSMPPVYAKPLGWNRERRIEEFTARMQAVRGEVYRVERDRWVDWINSELPARGMRRALVGRGPIAGTVRRCRASGDFELSRYDRAVDEWKDRLFHEIDFAITGTLAGLAESGSLVLWPDADEPRLMSLAPPLHVALLQADRLFENFAEMIEKEHWASRMPTNALLISGPSKTADIEQTLAFGIHGPKALITLILQRRLEAFLGKAPVAAVANANGNRPGTFRPVRGALLQSSRQPVHRRHERTVGPRCDGAGQ